MPHRSAPAIAGRDCVIGFDRLEGHAVSSGDAGAPIDRAAAAMIAVAAGRSNDAQFFQTPSRRIVSQPAASAGRAGGIAAAAARRHAGGRGDGRLVWRRRGASRADRLPPAESDWLILSAPAVWGRPTMDFWPKLALFAAVRFFPEMELTGRGLGIKPSDNLPMLKALMKDPMVIKGARVATIYGLVDLMDTALEAAPRLQMPFLLLYGAHDEIVPREALADFVAALPPDPAHRHRLAYYRNGYHLLLRDLEGAVVAGDVASWVFDPKAPLPSHADRREAVRPWPPGKDGGS